jgi:hypothetical protein
VRRRMSRVKIGMDELRDLTGESKKFPKYVGPIINLANTFAQGTRPRIVGQMSEMIKECPERSYDGWRTWYLSQRPESIDDATEMIVEMLLKFKEVFPAIDKETVRAWVEDLVILKTFVGMRFQEPILKRISSILGKDYKLSTPDDESKGIDGYVGDLSISIKPETYRTKASLKEEIQADVTIFYEKTKDGMIVDMSPVDKYKQTDLEEFK